MGWWRWARKKVAFTFTVAAVVWLAAPWLAWSLRIRRTARTAAGTPARKRRRRL